MFTLLDCRSAPQFKVDDLSNSRHSLTSLLTVGCVGNKRTSGLFELGAIEQRSSQHGIGKIGVL